jgi:hypothetical protein
MMRDDFESRQLVEKPGEDEAGDAGGGLVGPAESEPDLVLRGAFAGVVGELRAADRMDPDRQVVFRHAAKDRAELGQAQRFPKYVGEYLDAARAERPDGAIDFRDTGRDVVHRHRGDEAGEAVGETPAELGQPIIGDARQFRRALRRPQDLDRRIGQRQDLLISVELIEEAQPRLDVPQRRQLGKGGKGDVAGREVAEPVEDRFRHEVVEHVEHHGERLPGGSAFSSAALPRR